jgi:hypothetical protein|nr:hypothetical protein [Kofleriaceae bacterium]
MRLLLDERILADGRHCSTWASMDGGRVRIADDGDSGALLSVTALDRVMARYGKPLADDVAAGGDTLDCGDGRSLRRLRFHAVVDATGRDYLVWERPGEEPVAVLATTATAALRYLALRLATEN